MNYPEIYNLKHISISPTSFTIFKRPINVVTGEYRTWKRKDLDQPRQTNGKISINARKRINKAFSWLMFYSETKQRTVKSIGRKVKFNLNFITLTLSAAQCHSDEVIKAKLLNNFLTVFRTKYGCVHYLWKAERQKNGNIHFHIISDCYIHFRALQDEWNRIQNTLGYIDKFQEKYGHTNPHSTEVKAVRKIKKLKGYFAKYILKDDTENPIKGRLWFASKSLLNPPKITATEADVDFSQLLQAISQEKTFPYITDHSQTFFISIYRLSQLACASITEFFREGTISHWISQKLVIPDSIWKNLCRIG